MDWSLIVLLIGAGAVFMGTGAIVLALQLHGKLNNTVETVGLLTEELQALKVIADLIVQAANKKTEEKPNGN